MAAWYIDISLSSRNGLGGLGRYRRPLCRQRTLPPLKSSTLDHDRMRSVESKLGGRKDECSRNCHGAYMQGDVYKSLVK